ncbi:unnamed protein product [Cladocopium goreaui]|uniref:Uncharacterized protein n=1 Tax=Cladocopium goreaui TaxID=2562237 RepID=A0A9P1DCG5_9DINO|nr:unnamed protein product [Cladocopium goreaui]
MAAAHVLADAVAKVLCDDKEMQRGISRSLGAIHDIDEQLVAIDSLSEKGLGLQLQRDARDARDARRLATPLAPPTAQPPTPEMRQSTPARPPRAERFVMWSPMVDAHIAVRDADELNEVDRSTLILEVPRPLKGSTSLPELRRESQEIKSRRRKVQPDAAAELRRSALNMGLPPQLTTTYNSQCMVPVQKAVDPKWSSDLKRADWRNAQRIQYDNRLSASTTGSISPEMHFLERHH